MEWTDDGIVLGIRRHGEASAILEAMTRQHGRHLGLVRGGAGSRMRPILQPGNEVRLVWRARLDEHLGTYMVEGLRLRAASFLDVSHAVYAITHVAALARLLPERDPHEDIYESLDHMLDHFGDPATAAFMVVRFELLLLTELGFGLDLLSCAATGATSDLIYVSPKSGRAVSRESGEPWRDKLLRLPDFLATDADQRPSAAEQRPSAAEQRPSAAEQRPSAAEQRPSAAELADGFRLTGFFLARHVLEPRGLALPDARSHFVAAIARALPDAA